MLRKLDNTLARMAEKVTVVDPVFPSIDQPDLHYRWPWAFLRSPAHARQNASLAVEVPRRDHRQPLSPFVAFRCDFHSGGNYTGPGMDDADFGSRPFPDTRSDYRRRPCRPRAHRAIVQKRSDPGITYLSIRSRARSLGAGPSASAIQYTPRQVSPTALVTVVQLRCLLANLRNYPDPS